MGRDKGDYSCKGRHHDDETLREAIEHASQHLEEYDLFQNNCQDWTDRVLEDYERLRQEEFTETGLDPEVEFVWNRLVGRP